MNGDLSDHISVEWRDKGKVLEPSISISYIEKISSECYFDVFQQNSIGCRF